MIFLLAACHKEESVRGSTTNTDPIKPVAAAEQDTIPDSGAFKLRLIKDNTNYDETMFVFNHTAQLKYTSSRDAVYFAGNGAESLSSLSADGTPLAIYTVPFINGTTINLHVGSRNDGLFTLQMSYAHKIPKNIRIWLKDTYMKDSINLCSAGFKFQINKIDTNSFGDKRFKLVIRNKK